MTTQENGSTPVCAGCAVFQHDASYHSTPVEELIGWERMTWWGDYWWDGVRRRRRVEVDDLADWLHGQGFAVDLGGDRPGRWQVALWRDGASIDLVADTARDALEAAVRAVHEQEAD